MIRRDWRVWLGFVAVCLVATSAQAVEMKLFVAADVEDFDGGLPSGSGLDRIAVLTVDGASVISTVILPTDFLVNGMADADGKLLTGTPGANTLNTVAFDGSLISSIAAPDIPNSGCCNEEMLFVPTGGGERFFHAHYSDFIRELDPVTGTLTGTGAQSQTDVVGMALAEGEIWISKWAAQDIGTWDPDTNTFTKMFDLIGLGNAGALAYDPTSGIMWIGSQGGFVTPFNLSGVQQGLSVQPFGALPETIDGAVIIGEVTVLTPEPSTALLLMLTPLAGLMRRRHARA